MKNEDVAVLIRYRLEQAQTALSDAEYLLNGDRSSQSIVNRACYVNRAYYAMFYAAIALLQKIGKVPSKHSGVISIFDTEFVMKDIFPKELSKSLHKAFEHRQTSDYRTFNPISKEKVQEIVNDAAYFVNVIRKYFDEQQKKS